MLIIIASIIYKVRAVTSLFNFSCPFAITSLTLLRVYVGENDSLLMSLVVCQHANYYRR